MAVRLDTQTLSRIFDSRPDILGGIKSAADSPARVALFNDIASFVQERALGGWDEPALKRRRVDEANGTAAKPSPGPGTPDIVDAAQVARETVLLEVREISVSIPQRKKYDLCFTADHLWARAAGTATVAQGIVYAWKNIAHVFYLPVPEKPQAQYNYVIIPRRSCLPSSKAASLTDEPLVFTIPATAPKPGTVVGPDAGTAAGGGGTYEAILQAAIGTRLRSALNRTAIVTANPDVFHSAVRQSHRPSERAVHVKAFRGSKDGYLFFLPTGILWAFKKPLLLIPLERIVAVSYTSVLQRTFNMVVEVFLTPADGEPEGQTEEIEFSMIDQQDYDGINQSYIQRHGLQDGSMAEQRKAKLQLAENAKAGKRGGGEAAGSGEGDEGADGAAIENADGLTELQRAELEIEQKLQDEEDELEEDYVPESDGESDDSADSSDKEEGDDDDDDDEEDEEEEEDGEGEEGDDEEEDGGDEGEAEVPAPAPVQLVASAPVVIKVDEDEVMHEAEPVVIPVGHGQGRGQGHGYMDEDEDEDDKFYVGE